MKKLARIIVLTAAMTFIFALPVMANEDKIVKISSENTDQLITLIDAHNREILNSVMDINKFATTDEALLSAKAHMYKVYYSVIHEDKDICENHIKYLQECVNFDQTDLVNKKAIVDNFSSNPGLAVYLPQAQKDYDAAVAKLAYDQDRLATGTAKLYAKYYVWD